MSNWIVDVIRMNVFFLKVLERFMGEVKEIENGGSSGVSTTECVSM